MTEFRVWAPKPALVRLDCRRPVHPMTRSDDGWWHATVDAAPRRPVRLPARRRSHGAARPAVGPPARRRTRPLATVGRRPQATWTDGDWPGRSVEGAVIYELHIGTFTPAGTFDAAIEKLDYLVDLGIDFVELMPVNSFAGTHGWGYDGVLWYSVHEPYGGPDGLVRFVDACHARGLGVLIDAVFNHLGPSGNYLPRFGPYLSSASNPWGEGINIADADSDEVRRYIIGCALRWMRDFHADGLRLDAVHALVDTTAIHILEELATETDWLSTQLGRPLSLVAESDLNDPRLITPRDRRRLRDHRAMGRRHPSRHPHRGLRRAPGLLRGLRFAGHAGADAAARLLPRRHLFVLPAPPPRAAAGHRERSRPPGCSPTPAPTTRSATAPSGTARRRT